MLYYHAQIVSDGGCNGMNLTTLTLAESPTGQFPFDDQERLAWEECTARTAL